MNEEWKQVKIPAWLHREIVDASNKLDTPMYRVVERAWEKFKTAEEPAIFQRLRKILESGERDVIALSVQGVDVLYKYIKSRGSHGKKE